MIEVQPSGQACGALVTGIDLSREIPRDDVIAIRRAWMEHHVLGTADHRAFLQRLGEGRAA